MRPRSGTITPLLAPAALAVLLAVFAVMLARVHDDDARRLAEDRARLCLSLAAQTELRLEQLRGEFDAMASQALSPPPSDEYVAKALKTLRKKDAAFTHLALVDAKGQQIMATALAPSAEPSASHNAPQWVRDALASEAGETVGGLYPAPNETGRILFSRRLTLRDRVVHLRAEADLATLPAFATPLPRSITLIATSSDALILPPSSPRPALPSDALTDVARTARKASGLVRHPLTATSGAQHTALAVPMPGSPLVLMLVTPDEAGASGTSSTVLLLLAGGVLASLLPQILRRTKK